ncbi:Cholecystokinin receptor type A [Myotis brandtii]|uniref:Gastrin/cholecystokinin type B receptor n=1 Tax=Myotis brandtii TaxID=109478 RepID=S7PUX8_MYOBR|nr:Cholecystokinin receptor type A [Myotis brandtii]
MDAIDSFLVNGSNITLPCELGIENETLFCLDRPLPSKARRVGINGQDLGEQKQWEEALKAVRASERASVDAPTYKRHRKEWQPAVQILLYSLIFLLSVLGNTLVITVLIRNKRMRTVTNIFLLSLAVSDLMLCLFCMPFNLIPNLLKDFIFGSAVCKTTAYFMGTSVSVSTFNLVAISLERYGAICKPLQSRVWQTKSHALKVIAATWCLSFTIMTPYPVYSNLVPFTKNNNQTANMCRFLLPSDVMQQFWHTFLLLILFLIPGIVMMVAYGLISLELYQGIKFDASQKKSARERKASTGSSSGRYEDSDGCYLQRPQLPPLDSSALMEACRRPLPTDVMTAAQPISSKHGASPRFGAARASVYTTRLHNCHLLCGGEGVRPTFYHLHYVQALKALCLGSRAGGGESRSEESIIVNLC